MHHEETITPRKLHKNLLFTTFSQTRPFVSTRDSTWQQQHHHASQRHSVATAAKVFSWIIQPIVTVIQPRFAANVCHAG
jgi:hypothetical protein